jgi:hypothetical protein
VACRAGLSGERVTVTPSLRSPIMIGDEDDTALYGSYSCRTARSKGNTLVSQARKGLPLWRTSHRYTRP